jgi:hypothetical protein
MSVQRIAERRCEDMWRLVVFRLVLAVGLILSGGTTLALSKISEKEPDKNKKGTLGLGVLCSLVLFGIVLYHLVKG